MQKIRTFLWFDQQAEEAANYYVSVLKNGRILGVHRADGKVLLVNFELHGQQFMALNGGPHYKFTEAISLYLDCENQEEVDELWEKLSSGGTPGRCGWLKDKYGLSWQIIPRALGQLMGDPDPKKAQAVMQAMLKMNKIIIKDLERAHQQATAA